MTEQESIQHVADIVVNRVVEQLGDEKLNASRLIKSLTALTVEDVSEPDIGWDKAKYHATRLALELGNAKNDPDKDRRYINRIWKDLIEAYEVIEPSIENDLRKAGIRKILKPKKTDPKTGRVEFYLDIQDVEDRPIASNDQLTSASRLVIDYELVKRPKLSMVGKLFSSIAFRRRTLFIYTWSPFILIISVYLAFEYLNRSEYLEYATEALLFIIYAFVIAYVFRAFYQVRDRMIIKAPIWMTKFGSDGEKHSQLEIVFSEESDETWEHVPVISLVVYRAECPVCGSPVYVDRGAGIYKDRLIGKCVYSPVEHIYSFDHTTRKGVPLRSDTYLGSITGRT